VINFGVGGYGTIQALIQLKEAPAGSRTSPAIFIIAFPYFQEGRNRGYRIWRKSIICRDHKVLPVMAGLRGD
jgi:hypothetical protein